MRELILTIGQGDSQVGKVNWSVFFQCQSDATVQVQTS